MFVIVCIYFVNVLFDVLYGIIDLRVFYAVFKPFIEFIYLFYECIYILNCIIGTTDDENND